MAQMDLIANNLAGNFEMLKHHLADFSDADMLVRPVPGANHALWQLGHLLFFETMLCGLYAPQAAPKLPDDAKDVYGKAGASIDDAARFIKKVDALKLLGQAHAALVAWAKTLAEADLAKPSPEAFRGWVPTVGDLVLGIAIHTTMHGGQIQVIRRKLGKPHLF